MESVESGVRDSGDSVLLPVDLDEYSIENEFYKLTVDPTKGLVSTVFLKHLNLQMPFRQSIWKYYAYQVRNRSNSTQIYRNGTWKLFLLDPRIASLKALFVLNSTR